MLRSRYASSMPPGFVIRRFVARARMRKALGIALSRSEAFAVSLMLSSAALCAALRLAFPDGAHGAALFALAAAAAAALSVVVRFLLALKHEALPGVVAIDLDRGFELGEEFSTAFEIDSEGRSGMFEDALVLKSSASVDDRSLSAIFPVRWFWPAWCAGAAALLLAAVAPFLPTGTHPPEASRVSPAAARVEILRGAELTLCAAATDQGGDLCSFEVAIDGRTEFSTVEPMGGSALRSRSLRFPAEGEHRVEFRFGDSEGSKDSVFWTIGVKGDPRPPRAERLRPLAEKPRVETGEKIDFEASATDPDSDLSRWEVKVDQSSMDGGRGKLGSSARRTWSKSWDSPGRKKVSMSFSDSTGRIATVTWEVEIFEPGEDAAGGAGKGADEIEEPQNQDDGAGGGGGGETGGGPMLGEPERTPAQFEDVRVQPLFGPSGKTETAKVKAPMPKVGGPGRSPDQGDDAEFIEEELFARYEKMAERALGFGRIGREDRKTVTGYFESVRRMIDDAKERRDKGE